VHSKCNIPICFLLIAYFILIVNISCSYEKFGRFQINDKILTLKKGDLVFIALKDNTQIKGIFLEQKKDKIVIGKVENGVMKQESVKIDLIYKVCKLGEKTNKRPNVLVEIGLFLVILGLILFIGLNSSFPP